jgi:hypothetical protein
MSREPAPPRRRIDLRRLPLWQQRALALAVTVVVVVAAWLVAGDEPVPAWASEWLVPALGWLVLLIAAGILAVRLRRWLRRESRP